MCFLSTTFPNAPAHPPILFDQSLMTLFIAALVSYCRESRMNSRNLLSFIPPQNMLYQTTAQISNLKSVF